MRQILLVLALGLVACTGCHPPPPVFFSPLEQAASSVRVKCGAGGGSGVLLDSRTVLTAAHVIDCGKEIVVKRGNVEVPATITRLDPAGDVAALSLAAPIPVKPAQVGPPPPIDDRVCLEPKAPTELRACGWVLGHYHRTEPGDMQTSIEVWPGNSGSGVWDSQGRLVGIAIYLNTSPTGQVVGGRASSLWSRRWLLGGV